MITKNNTFLILVLFIINTYIVFGQGEYIYNPQLIHEIKFTTFLPNTWEAIVSNYPGNEYLPVHVTIDGTKVDSVGLRIKGNRINKFPNRPKYEALKVDINEFVKGQKYDGLKKLNLKNRNLVANHLLYKLALDNDIPSSRTSFAKVFIDNEYIGSYLLVEQIDKTYLKNTFGDKSGNLYKASGKGGHLEYLGTDATKYYYPYEKKTNEDENDYSDLIGLLNFFSNSSNTEFEDNIRSYLNIDDFIKALAIEMICVKRDAFYDAGRNYYLYNNPDKSQFEYIVDDFDYTMSILEYTDLNFQEVTSSIQPFIGSPIIDHIFQSNELKLKYYQSVCSILNNGFKNLVNEVDSIELLAQQNNFELYDLMDIKNSTSSIKNFINNRISVINTQLENNNFICDNYTYTDQVRDWTISVFPNPFSNQITISNTNSLFFEYKLFDDLGNLIRSDCNDSSQTLNLEILSPGLYFLVVYSTNSSNTYKLVKVD